MTTTGPGEVHIYEGLIFDEYSKKKMMSIIKNHYFIGKNSR